MGVSTNGQICYGIVFEEGHLFPWDSEEYDGNLEDWWAVVVLGYDFNNSEWFDEEGDYHPYINPDDYKALVEFWEYRDNNLPPVEVINYQSYKVPAYIIAVRGSLKKVYRGFPEAFEPSELTITEEQEAALINFCKTYCGITELDGEELNQELPPLEPKWYLSSFWGI